MPAYHTFQELRIAALNRSIAGLQASRIRMHVCWGAHKGPHNTDIPLKDIVDLMLDVQVEAYSVEAANPRHAHEWYLWEHVKLPAGKISSQALSATTRTRSSTRSWWQNASATITSVVARQHHRRDGLRLRHQPATATVTHLKLQTLVAGARLASQKLWNR